MNKFAIIVAGGSGTRMGSNIPKQFLPLDGMPILMHSLTAFHAFDAEMQLILVLPSFQVSYWEKLCEKHHFKLAHRIVAGGNSRFQSVRNGLESIAEKEGIVFIHDGVRPLISLETIKNCYLTATEKGNALPVVPLVDSIRELTDGQSTHKDRANYRLVQTPQTFLLAEIKAAFQQKECPLFTDDASVLEAAGGKINLVDGNSENIKITTPKDLALAEILIKQK
ncbi:MAG: 2-C-methyl-D-erythritol 4-phosphate cytidylyltransferase [Mangrovibacterium sp.]